MRWILISTFVCIIRCQINYSFRSNGYTGIVPPDSSIVVGKERVVTMVNGQTKLFNKWSFNLLDQKTLESFYNKKDPLYPRCVYDTIYSRFILVTINGESKGDSFIRIAVSNSDNPNTLTLSDWYFHNLSVNEPEGWADYLQIGVDKFNLYISCNISGYGTRLWIISKQGMIENYTVIVRKFELKYNNEEQYWVQPAWNWDTNDYQYLVSIKSSKSIILWTIHNSNNFSFIYISSQIIDIPSFSMLLDNAKQLGGRVLINTNDFRLQNCQIINGELWTSHTTGIVAQVRWYKIDIISKKLVDTGIIFGMEEYYYYPVISTDINGNTLVAMIKSSDKEYASIYYTIKINGGEMTNPVLIKDGLSYYTESKIGDYGGIALDPVDKRRIWIHHVIPVNVNQWNTWVFSTCIGCEFLCDPECENGLCNKVYGELICLCNPGFTGISCSECECVNGGVCDENGICNCLEGYSGVNEVNWEWVGIIVLLSGIVVVTTGVYLIVKSNYNPMDNFRSKIEIN